MTSSSASGRPLSRPLSSHSSPSTWVAALTRGGGPRRWRPGPGPDGSVQPGSSMRSDREIIQPRRDQSPACGSCATCTRHWSTRPGSSSTGAGAFERIGWLIEDWDTARRKLADTEARMVATLDELALTDLVCSIHGLSAVGAAAILAETGDLRRFTSARAVVKHAGLAPRERMSGTFTGQGAAHRRRTTGTPGRGLAGDVGSDEQQRGLRRAVPPSDDPRGQQAQADPGADRDRGSDPAGSSTPWSPPAARGTPTIAAGGLARAVQGSSRLRAFIARGRVTKAESGRAFCGIENPRVSRR